MSTNHVKDLYHVLVSNVTYLVALLSLLELHRSAIPSFCLSLALAPPITNFKFKSCAKVQPLPHNCNMEKKLKRVLDFKLVYDCLAEACSGLVRLDTLLSNWPTDLAIGKLPQDCEKFWRQSANSEGFLDWESFSTGLEKALKDDKERLKKEKHRTASHDVHSHRSFQVAARSPIAQVTSGEIEGFLSSCQTGNLVKALAKAGRDVHRWQAFIHKQNIALPADASGTYDCSVYWTLQYA